MKKIVIIDSNLDVMGGVERIINTLSNKLCHNNKITVISNFKRRKESFYNYNSKIDYMYIIDESDSYTAKTKDIKYYLRRIMEKYKEKYLMNYLTPKMKAKIKDADVIVFGRIDSFTRYAKFLKNNNIKGKIIVRDAIHLIYLDNKTKKIIKKYFPKLVNTFIVSSDESIKTYKDFFGNNKINMVKIYNPLGIIPNVEYKYNNKTVVSLGRMDDVDQKGFKNLILAFNYVKAKYPDWKLEIYGNGLSKNKLEKIIIDNSLSDNVKLMESTKNVVQVLNKSSIYVMSSRFEGYANMLVEAMSCGIPSISYDWIMGVDDIISNQKNGTIVNLKNRYQYYKGETIEEDVKSLAYAIIDLIENKEKCDKYSKKASEIINTRDCDLIISKWENLIIK